MNRIARNVVWPASQDSLSTASECACAPLALAEILLSAFASNNPWDARSIGRKRGANQPHRHDNAYRKTKTNLFGRLYLNSVRFQTPNRNWELRSAHFQMGVEIISNFLNLYLLGERKRCARRMRMSLSYKAILVSGTLACLVVCLGCDWNKQNTLSPPIDSSAPLYERLANDAFGERYGGEKVRLTAHLPEGLWYEKGDTILPLLVLADGYDLEVHLRQPLTVDIGPGAVEISAFGAFGHVAEHRNDGSDIWIKIIVLEDAVIEIEQSNQSKDSDDIGDERLQ